MATITIPKRAAAPSYYTIPDAAKRYGIAKAELYAAIRNGELKAVVKSGKSRGYRVTDQIMNKYMENYYGGIY